jgi:transposase
MGAPEDPCARERLRLQRIEKYGPKSEKLSNAQLELLEGEPGVSTAEVEAESQREPLAASADADAESANKTSKKRRHPGRQQLPAHLPRVECGFQGSGAPIPVQVGQCRSV